MIKNLIFDFGDVLINLDKSAVPTGIERYGKSHQDPELIKLSENYEIGAISTVEFIKKACELLEEKDPNKVIALWNSTVANFPIESLNFIEQLKSEGNFRLFLLSNTNELHIRYVEGIMGSGVYNRFRNCFEGFYYSHLIGLRKPNANIFEFVLNKHKLVPQETLFIDDTQEHITGASSVGINTWHLKVGKETVHSLFDYL